MLVQRRKRAAAVVAVITVVVGVVGLMVAPAGSTTGGAVRGFDGSTIKVAGMGFGAFFGATGPIGPEARIQRFNDDNEIKGITIDYVGFEDDGNDPATALSVARKLVTQDQVFALVGDMSQINPKDYFTQQQVPFFGWGFDTNYCNPKVPTTKGWGYGYNGCQVNPQPARVIDYSGKVYQYVSDKLGKKNPTVALINFDNENSRSTMKQNTIAYKGSGFDVVYGKSVLPAPPAVISDYSPYASQLLTADDGEAPDVITCLVGTECASLYNLLQGQGFTGIFQHALYTDAFVKPFKGTIVTASNNNFNSTGIASLDQMRADVEKVKPGTKMDGTILAGYASADMFIQTLKKVVAKGGTKAITPAAVQKAASTIQWELKDLTGPISYPTASNYQGGPPGYCTGLYESDGTQWNTAIEYSCSKKTYPFKG